jgi:hypothetical protein
MNECTRWPTRLLTVLELEKLWWPQSWPAYWFAQGTMLWALFVIGHRSQLSMTAATTAREVTMATSWTK